MTALASERAESRLWAPPQRNAPFIFVMGAAKGKTLLELHPDERRRLVPSAVLPAVGRLAAS